MFGLQGWEIPLILFLALLIFGPTKLPQLARSVAQAIQEFRNASKQVQKEVADAIEEGSKAESPKQAAGTTKTT
jgi:TatA/E family protein of Tat protein translocase